MLRSFKNSLFIAKQYLCFHWLKSFMLVVALSIIIFVPFFLEVVVKESQNQLTTRGETTPLLLGSKGSTLDLTMNSLYFFGKQPEETNMLEAHLIEDTGLAKTIPLYTRFKAGKNPIIGTTPDYFTFRQLQMADGKPPSILGEAVVGVTIARKEGLRVGDSILSSPENLFDLAGVYPLKMTVVGVLKPTGTADDEVIFVDIETSWIITGLGHGHDDLAHAEDSTIVTSSAKLHNAITKDNINQFHFHGEKDHYPITAAIVIPNDHKSKTILLGRYQAHQGNLQLIQPKHVIDELIQSLIR